MAFLRDIIFMLVVSFIAYSYFNKRADTSSLKGKKVLVTGASQNIGEEIAYQYAKLGAKVVVTARREKVLQKVAAKCKELGAMQVEYIAADMSDESAYQRLIDGAVEKMGGLDILVLNHVLSKHQLWTGTKEDWNFVKKTTAVNYWSYVGMTMAAMPTLRKSQGQIIVVSSQAGRPALPNVSIYGATKAAIINFFSSLQMEHIKNGEDYPSITIGILGAINTDGMRWAVEDSKINVKGYPVPDTAIGLIEGGLRRDRYVYIPLYLRWIPLLREICPSLFDKAILYFVYG